MERFLSRLLRNFFSFYREISKEQIQGCDVLLNSTVVYTFLFCDLEILYCIKDQLQVQQTLRFETLKPEKWKKGNRVNQLRPQILRIDFRGT